MRFVGYNKNNELFSWNSNFFFSFQANSYINCLHPHIRLCSAHKIHRDIVGEL